jgi:signal transduction histidine kinase/CheY-like chemotaxis protein
MPGEITTDMAPETNARRVLALPSTRADGLAMAKLFGANQIAFTICASMPQLCAAQRAGAGLLIVSEEALMADRAELLRCVSDQPVWSDLPIMVLSRSGHESVALSELLAHLGNVSVVERPIRTSTLLSLVRSSLRARERQYQVRDHLTQQDEAQQTIREIVESERAARGQAERASRTKDEFLATLSHELRTPLNAVLGWTQVLRKSGELSSDAINAVTVIERNARAQAQIIEDLLDMSSIISGKVRLDVQKLDLIAVINATIETVRPTLQAKGVALHVALDPMADAVRGDSNRLQQVLWNLLTNAVKFTPKDGAISITLSRIDSHIEIDVADTGEGIEPAFLPHVFDRFRQADASTVRHHGGLGLGLSIVKQLVELHGGSISASSKGKGLGSTFRVKLPVMATTETSEQPQITRQHPARSPDLRVPEDAADTDLGGIKVLVVDDERDARMLLQRLLEDRNASVETASSAKEAITMLMQGAPDVLVSDIGMPEQDGYGLIRRIRSLPDGRSTIPAIALTAYARTEDQVKAIDAGFQLHLTKPVEPVELIAMVRSLAQRSAARS